MDSKYSVFDGLPTFFAHADPGVSLAALEVYICQTFRAYELHAVNYHNLHSEPLFMVTWDFQLKKAGVTEYGMAQPLATATPTVKHSDGFKHVGSISDLLFLDRNSEIETVRNGVIICVTFLDEAEKYHSMPLSALKTEEEEDYLPAICNIAVRDAESIDDKDLLERILPLVTNYKDELLSHKVHHITFICDHRDGSYPGYFTFCCLEYCEEQSIHYIKPGLAFRLELSRLSNFTIQPVFSENGNIHIYEGHLRDEIPTADYLISETNCLVNYILDALEIIGNNSSDLNNIFLNFTPVSSLSSEQIKPALGGFIERYGERLIIRTHPKSGLSGSIHLRAVDNQYAARELLQPKRQKVHLMGIQYRYDFPELFGQAFHRSWLKSAKKVPSFKERIPPLTECLEYRELALDDNNSLAKVYREPGTNAHNMIGYSGWDDDRELIPAGGGGVSSRMSSSDYPGYNAYRVYIPKIAPPTPLKKRKPSSPLPIHNPDLVPPLHKPTPTSPTATSHTPITAGKLILPKSGRSVDIIEVSNSEINNFAMKPAITLGELREPRILELLETANEDLCCEHVSIKDFDSWIVKNPELEQNKDIRYEYNSFTERLIIKYMATPTHDSLHYFFNQTFSSFLIGRIGSLKASQLFSVGSGTTFEGFEGKWSGGSSKLPDAFAMLKTTEFPAIVCESGFSESWDNLMQDARLWLLGTEGQTKIVVILSFTENQLSGNPVEDTTDKNNNTEEKTLIDSINKSTTQTNLARELKKLNQRALLKKPLIGELSATLHLFHATKDHMDIEEFFKSTVLPLPAGDNSTVVPKAAGNCTIPTVPTNTSTVLSVPHTDLTTLTVLDSNSTVLPPTPSDSTIPPVLDSNPTVLSSSPSDSTILPVLDSNPTVLPSPPSDSSVLPVIAGISKGIQEFQIPLEDIFGNELPEVLDPKDSIIFSLRELEAHVMGSLQGTTWSRALQRAKKYMKEKGVWKAKETFTQSKRQKRY
ncbi:acetyl-CoA carboxylase [Tuber borchii]|uniref:Acetyl-CoA carboxylase n=1 Tax=Tuber borchii TaxID=42251 RepID=A0A2T6Z9N3_TUBBO|nr:acetyl-CoA carboxylase [Tuber borchii]